MSDFEEQMEDLVYVPFPPFRPGRLQFWRGRMNSERGSRKLMIRSNETSTEPPDDLLLTHKTLMALLLQYEHLTKRISSIQCEEGGNQATVQGAVARMAATFLTKEMLKVQVRLPLRLRSPRSPLFPFSLTSPRPLFAPISFLFSSLCQCSYLGILISGTTSVPKTPG